MKTLRQLLFSVALAAFIGILTYTVVTRYVEHKAQENLQSIILSHRSFHAYIQQVMLPTYYRAKDEGKVAQDFYAPQLLSSSYIIRVVHDLFNKELSKERLPAVYYKMASQNPRNPVNVADDREAHLIKLFNERRDLNDHTEIKTINGRKYLLYAKPFLETNQACIRCHGKRSDAPLGLQRIYSGQGGFNESTGTIRAIESIRIPLDDEFKAAFVATTATVAATAILIVLYLFNRRLRKRVRESTAALTESEENYRNFTSLTSDYVHKCARKGSEPYRIQWIGGALKTISGYSTEEMFERGCWLSITHPDDKDATAKALESLLPGDSRELTFRIIAKNQGVRWLSDKCRCIQGASNDELILYGAASDITERKQTEELLLFTRASVNNASDAIFWITPECRFVDVNDAACLALGYSREELLQMEIPDVDPNNSCEALQQQFPELRKLGTIRFESTLRTKDGRIFPVEVVANYVRHGNEERNCAMVRDISERRQMEEALRASNQFNLQIINSAHEGIIVYGTDLRYQVWNPFMEQLSGLKASEVLGKHPLEVFPFLKDVGVIERLEQVLAGKSLDEIERPFATKVKSGWNIDSSVPLCNEAGDVIGVIATVQDITERKLAEVSLRQSEEKFRSIVESSPLAMYFYRLDQNENLILTGANPSAERIIGISHFDLIGKRIEDAFPNIKDTDMEMYRKVAKGELEQQSFEITYNDDRVNGIYSVQVYRTGPEMIAVDFMEITDRKRAEEERQVIEQQLQHTQKLESLGVLSGGIAHDFNNILAIIMGYCSLTKMDYKTAEKN
ncbi:MAG: PAS domain S-box protein, partial [Pedobacter sp.]